MKEQWLKWQEQFLTLPENRRRFWMLFVIAIVLYIGVWMSLLPLYNEISTVQARQVQQQSQLAGMERELTSIQRSLAGDPAAALRRNVEQLQERLERIDTELQAASSYVGAADNREFLKQLLAAADGVTIQSALAMPVEVVYQDQDQPDTAIYKHRLQVKLTGTYFAVQQYFAKLDKLPWTFYWQSMDYSVRTHPNGDVLIELYTLSLERNYVAS